MGPQLPSIFILPANLEVDELHSLEESIETLTWDATEAEVIAGKITRRERALFELRKFNIKMDEVPKPEKPPVDQEQPPSKRRKTADSDDGQSEHVKSPGDGDESEPEAADSDTVKVVKLEWLTKSLEEGVALPYKDYLLYQGRRKAQPQLEPQPVNSPSFSPRAPSGPHSRSHAQHPRPTLLHETTSEHDIHLPPVPDFLHTSYSCQRPTPVDTPNADFIESLKEVRTLRLLEGDGVGVRAYSSSIAALAAYPHAVQSSSEVSRLPGCGAKIAQVWQQWKETGRLDEVVHGESNTRLSVLKLFYDIWGVGDTTAREFYSKGWRDLDDLVEFAWNTLSRVQQIGVKYYDEFQLKIPRPEVEEIANVILSHAQMIDEGFQMTIVGGYRRGKAQSGDVDIILSHPDETHTFHLIDKMVKALEKSSHITHTLTMSDKNSERGQAPLPWKGEGGGGSGSGFDTLDKALVVWQDPSKKGAPHRRVDIIISPWKTVGCAMLGWSGGTTFQRDLRRYCKIEKGLKFDSSGIRDRGHGRWVDLEGGDATGTSSSTKPASDMETAERRIFDGLGLQWRSPKDRCTG